MRDNGSPPPELSKRRTRRRSRPWSLAEQEVLVREHRKLGNAWASIKNSLPNRSTTEIKNAWYSSLRCKQPGIRSLLRSYVRAVQQFGEDHEARERAYNLAYDSIKHLDNSALSGAVDFDCWDEPEGDEPGQDRNPHPLQGSGPSSSTDVKAPPAFHSRDPHVNAAVSAARSSPLHPSRLQRQQSLPGALAGPHTGSAGSSPRVPPSAPNHCVPGSSGCNTESLCHPLSRSPDVQLYGRPNLLKEHAPDGADHPTSGLTATLMARLLLAQQGVREGGSVSTIEQSFNTAPEPCELQDGPEGGVLTQLGAGGCSGRASGDAVGARPGQRLLQPPSHSRQLPRLPPNLPPANEVKNGPLKLQAWWYDETTGVITGAAGVEELKLALLATLSSTQQHEQEQQQGRQLHRDAVPQTFERPAPHEQQQTCASIGLHQGGDSLARGSRQGHWKQRFRAGSGGAQAELLASSGPAASSAHLPGPSALGPWGSGPLGTCSVKVGPSHSSLAMPHFASEPASFTRTSHPRSQGKRLSDDNAFADGAVEVMGRSRGPPGRRLSSLPMQMGQHHGFGHDLGLGSGLERQDSHGAGPDAADGEEHSTHEIAAFLDAQRRQRLREESIQSPAPAAHDLPGGLDSCLRPEDARPPAANHLPRWSSVPGLAPSLGTHDAVGRVRLRDQLASLVDQDDAPGPGGRLQPYGTSGQAALLLQQQRAASLGAELQRLAEAGLLSGPTLSRLASSLGSGMAGDGGGFGAAGGGSRSGSLLRGGSGDREEGLDLGPVSAGSTSSVASAQAGGSSGPMQWESGASAGGGGFDNPLGGRAGAAGRMLAGVGGVALVQRGGGAGVRGGARDPLAREAARRLQQQQWERERELQVELLRGELCLWGARGREVKAEVDAGTSMDVDGHGDEVAGRGHLQADAAVSATFPTRLAAALDLTRKGNAGALDVLRSLSGAGVERW